LTILPLRLLLSFYFHWEDISNTWEHVSSAIQTPQILSKILHCMSSFQISSRWLDIPMKHCLSCLIYYIKLWMFWCYRMYFKLNNYFISYYNDNKPAYTTTITINVAVVAGPAVTKTVPFNGIRLQLVLFNASWIKTWHEPLKLI